MKISWLGDAAVRFEWQASDDDRAGGATAAAARAERVRALRLAGVRECVPAYRSITVHWDIGALLERGGLERMTFEEVTRPWIERIRQALEAGDASEPPAADRPGSGAERHAEDDGDAGARVIRLPVIYGGEDGPDLDACAERCGMTPEAFAQAHASARYEVAMIGFTPGFPYMTGLPEALAQPRRASPRLQVPPGAVGVAGLQTGIYPVRSPGGWQWIGRTPVPLFRPEAEEPFLLKPGDRVAFVPVSAGGDSAWTIATTEDAAAVRAVAQGAVVEVEDSGSDALAVRKFEASEAGQVGGDADALEVRKPGMLTTVQDRGRYGWQSFGVSVGGAMDAESMRIANVLVGNPTDAAALEMTAIGAEFRAMRDLLVAASGADLDARIDGEAMPMHRPVWLRAGSVLAFGAAKRGCRAYLAVAGGVATPELLGSRSADLRFGLQSLGSRAIAAGDRVPVGKPTPLGQRIAADLCWEARRCGRSWAAAQWAAETAAWPAASPSPPVEIRILPGAQWEAFTEESRKNLLRKPYRVTADSDRMGLRLSGPALTRSEDGELASHGVVPGTIQVPAGGLPIALAAGCQPTGGYPVIAHVIRADLPLLAQCMPGAALNFRLVEREEAWQALAFAERQYRLLRAGIQLAEKGQTS